MTCSLATISDYINKHSGVFGEDGKYITECWVWIGHIAKNGYGRYGSRLAHKLVYGNIPSNKQLDHLCRNRSCVNPKHLEVVSQKINILRGVGAAANNHRKSSCKHGHAFSNENTYVDRQGHRNCRTCDRLKKAKRRS